jgi:predicted dehydrogenase
MAGAGFASGLHLAGWKRLAGVDVLGICDPVITKAAARAREFGGGTRGVARLKEGTLSLRGDWQESIAVDLAAGYGDSYAATIAHFASALAANTPFETDVSDNLSTLVLVESAYSMAGRQEKE